MLNEQIGKPLGIDSRVAGDMVACLGESINHDPDGVEALWPGQAVTKFMATPCQGLSGVDSGRRTSNGVCRVLRDRWQVWKFLTNRSASTNNFG